MRRGIVLLAILGTALLSSCSKKDTSQTAAPAAEQPAASQPAAAQPPTGPHAFVHLKDGSKVPGTIVASDQTNMVVDGDDGIERKIPMAQVQSVEYAQAQPKRLIPRSSQPSSSASQPPAPPQEQAPPPAAAAEAAPPPPPPPPPPVTTRTYVLPAGSEVSVRTNEPIDSATAAEGQTFSAQVTRSAKDRNGDVVIPRGATAQIIIRSASKGGRFRGASDLVLDLQSVEINGKPYAIETAEVAQKGKSGVGANKRTAEYTGGGAALGAIIGAIAGGGKGAAIGAGAGAGAGALTQVLTKGGSIKVPAESVLTFSLDKPLHVTAEQ
ncbi:MAG TPA: hypothetical protein VG675_18355 [Bryobacteraceae bacterium]|nr:hypothetical protein [Bryobacteraceae bacterium]